MATSLIQRVNNLNAPRVQSQKSISLSGDGWLFNQQSTNRDLRADEWGAAQAVAVVTEVQRAVKFWQQWLSGLTWHIYDGNTDKILCSSNDRKPPTGNGTMWFRAMQRFSKKWKHDFFESIAFSDWVYAETYIGKLRNQIQASDFMWLNPLAIEPMIYGGQIAYYAYQSDDPNMPYQLRTEDVSFRIAQRNPFDDLRGISPIISTINKININENAYKSLNSYYRNNMQLGGIVSGKPANEGAWSVDGNTLENIKNDMQRNHKGVADAWRWFFSNAPVDVQQFEQIDLQKNFTIIEPIRKQVMMAMGVPPVLAGDPTDATYENTDDSLKNWYKTDGIPYGRKVEKFINSDLLIAVEPDTDIYFGFDFAPYEVENPETVSADFTAGYSEITESQKKRGLTVDSTLEGIYIINGRPMHRDIIAQVAKQIPPEYAAPPAPMPTGEPTPPPPTDSALPVVTGEPIAPPIEPKKKYDPNQPRADNGQFGSGGGSSGDGDSDKPTDEPKQIRSFWNADDPLSNDLRKWQTVAMKRYKSGNITDAATFESDVLPTILKASIRGALQAVTLPDQIYTIFDDAVRYLAHA